MSTEDMAVINTVMERWKSLQFEQIQKSLDSHATEVAERQEQSEKSRKLLVETTKEFRKLPLEEGIKKSVATVLKAYQNEVDALSRRARAAEQSVLDTYKRFHDMPDPAPALESILTLRATASSDSGTSKALEELREDNERLRGTLADYHRELAEVKNQEVTIKQLREKVKSFEGEQSAKIAAGIAEERQRLQKEQEEMQARFRERESQLQKLAGTAEATERRLLQQVEEAQSKLMEVRARADEQQSTANAELEMLMNDIERANNTISQLEKEVESLKSVNAASHERQVHGSVSGGSDAEIAAKEREIAELVNDVRQLQQQRRVDSDKFNERLNQLEQQNNNLLQDNAQLREALKRFHDYDELRTELAVLKDVEFGDAADHSRPLEALLLDKTRELQGELSTNRLQLSDQAREIADLKVDNERLSKLVMERSLLITRLESDLLVLQPRSQRQSSVQLPMPVIIPTSSATSTPIPSIEELLSPTTSSSSALVVENTVPSPEIAPREVLVGAEAPANDNGGTETSLLGIVAGQRDRLRRRIIDLESEVVHHQQQVTSLRAENERVRGDNVQLYEKIKFLQSYTVGDRRAAMQNDALVERYSNAYEETLNPFKEFGTQEKQKRIQALSGVDRVTLGLGRLILGSPQARKVFFFYSIILHILVFLVVYKLGSLGATLDDYDQTCTEAYASHMIEFHRHKE